MSRRFGKLTDASRADIGSRYGQHDSFALKQGLSLENDGGIGLRI
jgi:hypothetical protein